MNKPKRVFGRVEAAFDFFYLCAVSGMAVHLLRVRPTEVRQMAGYMALLLAAGDALHLLPRMAAILTGKEAFWAAPMGIGKFFTSLTMTAFYLMLWQIGLTVLAPDALWFALTPAVYLLAAVRVVLCLFPQNRWLDASPPVLWGIYRNIPFVLLGGLTAALFAAHMGRVPALGGMWVAILLSFGFYLPVVLLSNRWRAVGMLMLPKTCAYLYMIALCLSL